MVERHSLVLAHPDDDLVFMCPTLIQLLQAGHAVQSIYLTAGDAGRGAEYWRARENGMVAAYTEACGVRDFAESLWKDGPVPVPMRASADGRIRLYFLRLPDGMLDARGTAQSQHTSLPLLWEGRCERLHALDGSGAYTRSDLMETVTALMAAHGPQVVHMLNPGRLAAREHPDHQAAGLLAAAAAAGLRQSPQLRAYVGSDSPERPANVHAAALEDKHRVFAAYARFDSEIDLANSIYLPMLAREYLAR